MKKEEARTELLFDLSHTEAAAYLKQFEFPWEALSGIRKFILEYGAGLSPEEYEHPAEDIWIHKTAEIFESAYIAGPCVIGAGTQVRHCAFIRGSAFIGRDCVIGNSTELKNVIISDHVQVPHYNYVGDSVLGYHSHLGAGAITSNVRSDGKNVVIHFEDENTGTGIRKAGAFLGDHAEIGCGSVLNPGTVVGKCSNVYPLSSVRIPVNAGSIYKKEGEVALKIGSSEV